MRWAVAVAVALVLVPGAAAYKNPTPGRALVVQIPGMHRAKVVHRSGLDVYRPRSVRGPLPAVVLEGKKRSPQTIGWAQLISASGMAAVASSDVGSAIAYLRAHAAALGIDRGRLCALAFASAPPLEAQPWLRCGVIYYAAPQGDPATMPPLLVVKAGRDDAGTNESIDDFEMAALASHADVRVVAHETARAGFDVGSGTTRSRAVVRETLRYLSARLARPLRILEPCTTAAERASVLRFFTSEDVQLAGVLLGTGTKGIVLSHGSGGDLCEWLPHARELASAGYRVLTYDTHALLRVDREMAAAVEALRRSGAQRVAVAGSSLGALASLTGAALLSQQPDVVISLSSPNRVGPVDGVAAVRKLHVPVLFVAEQEDQPFADDARELYAAATSPVRRLEIFPGSAHGVGMLEEPSIRTLFDAFLAMNL
jgi:dienelactone hydrolase